MNSNSITEKVFMSLKRGNKLVTPNGAWIVELEPTLSGNLPKVLLRSPNEEVPQFVHYHEGRLVDDDANIIPDLVSFRVATPIEFKIIVFFKRGNLNDRELKEKVVNFLQPFDKWDEAHDPYREYLLAEEIKGIIKKYGISESGEDINEKIVSKLPNWSGDNGGFDKEGVYRLTTKNPNGHLRSHKEPKLLSKEERISLLESEDLPTSVIFPDGRWTDKKVQSSDWLVFLKTILKEYENKEAFLVDCSS